MSGTGSWFDRGFRDPGLAGLRPIDNAFSRHMRSPLVNPAAHDHPPAAPFPSGLAVGDIALPPCPGALAAAELPLAWQYVPSGDGERCPPEAAPALGAYTN